MCAFPLVGDLIGKGGKGLKRVSSAGMETVLKAVKTGEKALDRLEITYKAPSGKTEELKRYLDEGTELFFKIVDDTGESVSYTRSDEKSRVIYLQEKNIGDMALKAQF